MVSNYLPHTPAYLSLKYTQITSTVARTTTNSLCVLLKKSTYHTTFLRLPVCLPAYLPDCLGRAGGAAVAATAVAPGRRCRHRFVHRSVHAGHYSRLVAAKRRHAQQGVVR